MDWWNYQGVCKASIVKALRALIRACKPSLSSFVKLIKIKVHVYTKKDKGDLKKDWKWLDINIWVFAFKEGALTCYVLTKMSVY